MTLTPEQKEAAAKALQYTNQWAFIRNMAEMITPKGLYCDYVQSELAKVGLAIQPLSAGFVNVKLLSACRQALKVVSEIADIDVENRAGWCHKELSEVIDEATAIQPIEKEKE